MKKKILGITVLLAVLAMGLVFTACDLEDDSPITLVFANNSSYDIFLTFSNPSATYTLAAPKTAASPATTYEHPCTKKTKFGWSVPSAGAFPSEYYVVATPNGAGLSFTNNPDGPAQNKIDTVEFDD